MADILRTTQSLKHIFPNNQTKKNYGRRKRKTQSCIIQKGGDVEFNTLLKLDTYGAKKIEVEDGKPPYHFDYNNGVEVLYHDFKLLWDMDKHAAEL